MYKPSDFMGSTEAARRLGVDKSTLTRQVERGQVEAWGKLPGSNGALIFQKSYIDRLAAERNARAVSTDA